MKKQIIVIYGGDTFETYNEYLKFLKEWEIDFEDYINDKGDWKRNLGENLGEEFEIVYPNMPNKINAKYLEWKIWFDKFIPHFKKEILLVGHSLGGTFLVKYLSENNFPSKIRGVFLVAPPHDDKDSDFSLADFILPDSLEKMENQADKIFVYFSEDDPVVPFADKSKYEASLGRAVFRIFKDRGHFNQEEFPEIISDIKGL